MLGVSAFDQQLVHQALVKFRRCESRQDFGICEGFRQIRPTRDVADPDVGRECLGKARCIYHAVQLIIDRQTNVRGRAQVGVDNS